VSNRLEFERRSAGEHPYIWDVCRSRPSATERDSYVCRSRPSATAMSADRDQARPSATAMSADRDQARPSATKRGQGLPRCPLKATG
jgi:hypothetical protein